MLHGLYATAGLLFITDLSVSPTGSANTSEAKKPICQKTTQVFTALTSVCPRVPVSIT